MYEFRQYRICIVAQKIHRITHISVIGHYHLLRDAQEFLISYPVNLEIKKEKNLKVLFTT